MYCEQQINLNSIKIVGSNTGMQRISEQFSFNSMKIILNKYFKTKDIQMNFILVEIKLFYAYLRDLDYAKNLDYTLMYVYINKI